MRRYIDTPTARIVRDNVQWAAKVSNNLLITGPAGIGKTAALNEVLRQDKRAVLITITPAQRAIGPVLSMVTEGFGYSSHSLSISALHGLLSECLPYEAAAGRHLMVDEAQLLPADAMRQLLTYSDRTDWPLTIVFAGNEHALKRTRANAAGYDQIRSRIGKHVQIKGISSGDIEGFCIDWDVEARDAYALMHAFGASRNCREVDKLLSEARRLTGSAGSIKAAAIRDAITSLYGRELARKLSPATTEKEAA